MLGLAQRAINQGNTKAVVFVTGDQVANTHTLLLSQHWAELMAKQMPESEAYGPAQVTWCTMVVVRWSGGQVVRWSGGRKGSICHRRCTR